MNYGEVEEPSSSRSRRTSTARRAATSATLTVILSRSDRASRTSCTVNARRGLVNRAGHVAIERRQPSNIGDDEGRSDNELEPGFDGCREPHEPSPHLNRPLPARTDHAVREPTPHPETWRARQACKFHKALVDRKYRLLFSSSPHRQKPGPKGPAAQLVAEIVAMKRRNPRFGCVRIAQQISHAFGLDIDKDVVRRVLAKHYRPGDSGTDGPSWLTFIGHAKDSLWSVDLFRCESILLKSYWVMVVMDIFTRRIIGFGVAPADVDGVSVCRMFNGATAGQALPKHLSTDHHPLFRFHRWLANLRVLDIEEIKSVPYTPVSHPFVERLIGTIRREYL